MYRAAEVPSPTHSRYAAFISYSHAADGRLAPALQQGLQRFATPWYRLRSLRVFRDETGLAPTPELWGEIVEALQNADYFLLLASPEAAASSWVEKEVDWWLAHKSVDRLLIVATDGEIVWDPASGDFDWQRSTALPKRLQRAFAGEPLFVDLRWARSKAELTLDRPDFADAIARLSATLRRLPLDEVIGEHVRQHRRTLRLARTGAIAAVLIGLLALVATYHALQARKWAGSLLHERDTGAMAQAKRTLAMRLAEEAVKLHSTNPELAVLLAAEAVRNHPGDSPESALRQVLFRESTPTARFTNGPGENCFAAFHPKGTGVLIWGAQGLRLVDPNSGQTLVAYAGNPQGVADARFARDGRRICALAKDDQVRIWDVATEKPLIEWPADRASVALPSPNAERVLLLNEGIGGALWDANKGTKIADIDFVSEHLFLFGEVPQASFAQDGRWVAVLTRGGNASVIETASGTVLHELSDHAKRVNSVAFSTDAQRVVTASEDGTLRIWRAGTGASEAVLSVGVPLYHAKFSADDRWVAAQDATGNLHLLDLTNRLVQCQIRLGSEEAGPHIFEFSPNGRCVLTASYGYDFAVLWEAWTGQRLAELRVPGEEGPIRTTSFTADGRQVVLGAIAGPARTYATDVCGAVTDLLSLAKRRVPRQLTAAERSAHGIPDL